MRAAGDDVLLHALADAPGMADGDPPLAFELVWVAARDRVEVRGYDLWMPPTEPPFYQEDARTVGAAERLWEKATGRTLAWDGPPGRGRG